MNINKHFVSIILIIFISTFFTLFLGSCNNNPPIKVITINDNGNKYNIEAVSGQVIAIFKPTISNSKAVRLIKNNNGKIISKITKIRYYLVDVGIGNESNFIKKLKNHNDIQFIYLNTIVYPCENKSQMNVIDHFYISHGESVTYVLGECGIKTKINKYNAGIKGTRNFEWKDIDNHLFTILSKAPKNTPVVINMSFGPDFVDDKIHLWTDKNITENIKASYREHYKMELQKLIAIASYFKDNDFVIVKAAGNEGLKNLDDEILLDLLRNVSDDDFKILNDHFLLVGAEDSRNPSYSNSVSKGYYNSLFTSVDISDLKQNNKSLEGTSYAAPRVACFISTAVEDNKIKATEAIKAIKDITHQNSSQPITQEGLNREAKRIAEYNKKTTTVATQTTSNNEINNVVGKEPTETIKSNPRVSATATSNIIGTRWEFIDTTATNWLSVNRVILDFKSDYTVEITNYFVMGSSEINYMYKYYREENGSWVMYQTTGVRHLTKMSEEEERKTAIRMYNYFIITAENNKLYLSDAFGTNVRVYSQR